LIDPNLLTPNGCATNAGDKGFRLRSLCADADRVGLAASTVIPDVDVIAAASEIASGIGA
jgi:hypothetical protein